MPGTSQTTVGKTTFTAAATAQMLRVEKFSIAPGKLSQILPPSEAAQRLAHHRAVLEGIGISDLATLGKLSINGTVVPQIGATLPRSDLLGASTLVQRAFRVVATPGGNSALQPFGGNARFLNIRPLPSIASSPLTGVAPGARLLLAAPPPINLNVAYWAAQWIDIADDTTVVLRYPNRFLVILAEKITVGRNVTFTWERPTPATIPSKPPVVDPRKQPGQPIATTLDKPGPGLRGTDGVAGGTSPDGVGGPSLELWTIDLTGQPAFDLRGQDGWQGGEGGNAGDGGDGAPGRADFKDKWGIFCASGPGNGGDGGDGGNAAKGGTGGNGGVGGQLDLYMPQAELTTYASNGFYISVDGGVGGAGGIPGVPGQGGAAGPVGSNSNGCAPSTPRSAGNAGKAGSVSTQGAAGHAGDHGTISMHSIDRSDMIRALELPAVISLATQSSVTVSGAAVPAAKAGEFVTVNGARFLHDDVVLLNGVACQTQVSSDTLVTFQVPANVAGGRGSVQVRQTDGTLSLNKLTLLVVPTISAITPGGNVKPGSTVRLTGSGFVAGCRVRVNGEDMPGVAVLGPTALTFTLKRPANIVRNPTFESGKVDVVLADGTGSNTIDVRIDTFRMLVFGDSIAWGQGLTSNEKYSGLVELAIRRNHAEIGVYTDVFAHSGAILGAGVTTRLPAVNGEIPTGFPTVTQQVMDFVDDVEDVDLILIDGGINDTDVTMILDPRTTAAELERKAMQFCHTDMAALLKTMVTARAAGGHGFTMAKIVVTGYYRILTEESDTALFFAFAEAAGLALGGIPGMCVAGVATVACTQQMIANCQTFATAANASLKAAVADANAAIVAAGGTPRVFFADPMFTPRNAALAPDAFVFGINLDLSPQDETVVSAPRASACTLAAGRTNVEVCKRASIGHPNPRGAQAYANAIIPLI